MIVLPDLASPLRWICFCKYLVDHCSSKSLYFLKLRSQCFWWQCFFPQEFIGNIKTPVFLVQPAYDFWQVLCSVLPTDSIFLTCYNYTFRISFQIENIYVPKSSDPHGSWRKCRLNIFNCNSNQLEVLHGTPII